MKRWAKETIRPAIKAQTVRRVRTLYLVWIVAFAFPDPCRWTLHETITLMNGVGIRLQLAPESVGSSSHPSNEIGHNKSLQHQVPLEKQGCIPFLGLFVFDLTHITVSPAWYLPLRTQGEDDVEPRCSSSIPATPKGASHPSVTARLQAPDPNDLQELVPTGTLLVHVYRFQLIGESRVAGSYLDCVE